MKDLPEPSKAQLRIGYPLARIVGWILLTVLGPFWASGRRNVPKKGGLLIVANHRSLVDPVAAYAATRRHVCFMARGQVWERPTIAKIMRWFTAFRINPGEFDREAIKVAVAYLQKGYAVCIFPEGTLTMNGKLQEIKPGIALIQRLAKCPMIPLGLLGTERIVPHDTERPRPAFTLVRARWGEPKLFDSDESADEVVAWVERELRRLTDEPDPTPKQP